MRPNGEGLSSGWWLWGPSSPSIASPQTIGGSTSGSAASVSPCCSCSRWGPASTPGPGPPRAPWAKRGRGSVAQSELPAILFAHRVGIARSESGLQNLLDRGDQMDLDVVPHVLRKVLLDRLLVPLGEDDLLDPEAVCRHGLLLHPAHAEPPAGHPHLPRHAH